MSAKSTPEEPKRPDLTIVPADDDTEASSAEENPESDGVPPVCLQVTVDKSFFEYATSGEIEFPEDAGEPIDLSFTEQEIMIGRRSLKHGTNPEIDLAKLTADPAVSNRHAMVKITDEGPVIVDLGSTNGTIIGDPASPDIEIGEETQLPVGTAAYFGAWTKLVITEK